MSSISFRFKKMKKPVEMILFSRILRSVDPGLSHCLGCVVPNGECNQIAMEGRCRAYSLEPKAFTGSYLKFMEAGDTAYLCICEGSNAELQAGIKGKEGTDPEKFIIPCEVLTIGRKYITVLTLGSMWEREFYKDGDLEGTEAGGSHDYRLYASHQEALDDVRARYLRQELRKQHFDSLDLDALEKIYQICSKNKEEKHG